MEDMDGELLNKVAEDCSSAKFHLTENLPGQAGLRTQRDLKS